MSTLTIRIPDSLRRSIEALAKEEGYSNEQFFASAAAEKLAALLTLKHLRREAASGCRDDYDRIRAAVPDIEPSEGD